VAKQTYAGAAGKPPLLEPFFPYFPSNVLIA
jgi:hypothetical protein